VSSSKSGLYLSAASILAAAATLGLVDLHKRNLRKQKRRRLEHTRSFLSTGTTDFTNSACPQHSSSGGAASEISHQQRREDIQATHQKLAALAASTGAAGEGASLALIGGAASSTAGLPVGVPLPAVASYTNLLAAAAAAAVSEHVSLYLKLTFNLISHWLINKSLKEIIGLF